MTSRHKFRATQCGIARRFLTLSDAEHYARRQCAASGETWRLESTAEGSNGHVIATVKRDALGHVWTDVEDFQSAFI